MVAKDVLVEGVELNKKTAAEKDVTEAVDPIDDYKKEKKDPLDCLSKSVEVGIEKTGDIERVELNKAVAEKDTNEAMIPIDDRKKGEKDFLDHLSKSVELVSEKTGRINYQVIQQG